MLMLITHMKGFMEFGTEHGDIKKNQALLINNRAIERANLFHPRLVNDNLHSILFSADCP